jgi:hypothetical protein
MVGEVLNNLIAIKLNMKYLYFCARGRRRGEQTDQGFT